MSDEKEAIYSIAFIFAFILLILSILFESSLKLAAR
jgi:hypothetical protein